MKLKQFLGELDISSRLVWLVISSVIFLILVSPFVLGRDRIARLVPVCQSKAVYGRPCSFCGMTTSFLDISNGRLNDAAHANRAGIPLYALFVINEAVFVIFLRQGGLACKFSA